MKFQTVVILILVAVLAVVGYLYVTQRAIVVREKERIVIKRLKATIATNEILIARLTSELTNSRKELHENLEKVDDMSDSALMRYLVESSKSLGRTN